MKYKSVSLILSFALFCLTMTFGQLNYKYESLPCLNKKFTILPHIVLDQLGNTGITENEIQASIDELNVYFEPICVSFELCAFDTITNWQFDVLDDDEEYQDLLVKYHKQNRINLFFVTETQIPNACGFAALGGIQILRNFGIVVEKGDCVAPNSKTIPHEMGHYFGLVHTFEGNGVELVDQSNCETTGDLICDTPADPYVVGDDLGDYVEDCRFISLKVDANGQFYIPDVGNIMSYYPDRCGCGFTHEQYELMAKTYEDAIEKMW